MSGILRKFGSNSSAGNADEEIVVEIDSFDDCLLSDQSDSEEDGELSKKNEIIYEVEGTHYRYVDNVNDSEKNRNQRSKLEKEYEEEEYNYLLKLHENQLKKIHEESESKEKNSKKKNEKRSGVRMPSMLPLVRVYHTMSMSDQILIKDIFIKLESRKFR